MSDNQSTVPNVMVQGVKLLPQDNINACWYASTMMMFRWQQARGGSAPDPSVIAEIKSLHDSQMTLPWTSMLLYAQKIGMRPRPAITPNIQMLADWLRQGPLWTDGVPVDALGRPTGEGHVVVLAGLREAPNSDLHEVFIYDPWPVNVGHQGWRSIRHLVGIMSDAANPERNVLFLSY